MKGSCCYPTLLCSEPLYLCRRRIYIHSFQRSPSKLRPSSLSPIVQQCATPPSPPCVLSSPISPPFLPSFQSPLTNLFLSDSSSPPRLLSRQDGSATDKCSRLAGSPICISNYNSIPDQHNLLHQYQHNLLCQIQNRRPNSRPLRRRHRRRKL